MWVPVTRAWHISGLQAEGTASIYDMEDKCEYIEQAVANSRQMTVLLSEGWASGYHPHRISVLDVFFWTT